MRIYRFPLGSPQCFWQWSLMMPDMYSSSETDAVFKSTPTLFTQSSTTPPSASLRAFSGSYHADTDRLRWISDQSLQALPADPASRLAMEVALLCPTSKFGNSSVASLLAEYTDAPASFTIIYCTFTGISFNKSTITCSDSRDAVPFPSEIRCDMILGNELF